MQHLSKLSIALLALLMVGAACQKTVPKTQSSVLRISSAEENAFGALGGVMPSPQATTETAGDASRSTATAPAGDLKMRPIMVSAYTYAFTGTPLSLTESTVNVFERNTGVGLTMPGSFATSAGLGAMAFNRLNNPNISTVTIRSGEETWYVDAINGTISMYLDMSVRLAQPVATPESSIAPDAAVTATTAIRVANTFLAGRGISTAPYGTPVTVNTSGVTMSEKSVADTTSSSLTIGYPSVATTQVIYPFMIDGVPAVQQNGDPVGLSVTVEPATETVTSVYGLNSLDFTHSAYTAHIDWAAIQKVAEQGGLNNYGVAESGTKTTTINLGTPERVLMLSYLYEEDRSREIYISALRFPLLNPPDEYMKYIVVPLAKDLPADSPIDILPMTTGSGSTEPAESQ